MLDAAGKLVGYRGADRDITERKLAEDALAQQADRAALTNRISQAVRRTLDVSEVFETAVRELGAHLEVDRCSLFMKDETAGRVTNAAEYHVSDVVPAGSDFDLPQVQALNAAMEKHGVLAFDDVANDERIQDLYQGILKRFDVKSYVRRHGGDKAPRLCAVPYARASPWSEADMKWRGRSDQTGIAIRQARLYQKAGDPMREPLVNKLTSAIRASLLTSVSIRRRELGQRFRLAGGSAVVRPGDQSFAEENTRASCEAVSDFDADYDECYAAIPCLLTPW